MKRKLFITGFLFSMVGVEIGSSYIGCNPAVCNSVTISQASIVTAALIIIGTSLLLYGSAPFSTFRKEVAKVIPNMPQNEKARKAKGLAYICGIFFVFSASELGILAGVTYTKVSMSLFVIGTVTFAGLLALSAHYERSNNSNKRTVPTKANE